MQRTVSLGMLCAKQFMFKSKSSPALMHTAALVAPAALPFAVVSAHVRPWAVDDAYLVRMKLVWALQEFTSRAKPQSSYSPRMQDPPPALEAPPAVEYETPPIFVTRKKERETGLYLRTESSSALQG